MVVDRVEKIDLTEREVESIRKVANDVGADITSDMEVLSKDKMIELI